MHDWFKVTEAIDKETLELSYENNIKIEVKREHLICECSTF